MESTLVVTERALAPLVEVLPLIPNGAIVRLPDGSIGEQVSGSLAESHVVHADRVLGRGPWIFARWQVEPATAEEALAYVERSQRALIHAA